MANRATTRKQAEESVAALAKYGTKAVAAAALKIPRTTFQSRIQAARRLGVQIPEKPEAPTVDQADVWRDRVYELESQVKTMRSSSLSDEYVKRKIIGLSEDLSQVEPPKWLVRRPPGDTLPGVPMTLWSDWHYGEVVYPAQVNGANEFDMGIASRRVRRLVEKVIYLLRYHVVNPEFPGLVVNLGGDMLSGDIHDELRETNEMPTMPTLLELFGVLKWALSALADEFGALFVPAVSGNHGRNTRKPRAKGRNWTNFDWLLYQFLAKAFEHDKRITFYIPDGPDALYRVYGRTYCLTHGDQFRGGDGMIGHFGPVLRGHKKKLSRNANIGLEFDTLLHGHFHTYHPTPRIIGNGSLKGYDEYANSENFAFEPPIQALWLSHPRYGITLQSPVYVDEVRDNNDDLAWASIPKAA